MKPLALIFALVVASVTADGFGGPHRQGRRSGRRQQFRRGRTDSGAVAPIGGYGAADESLDQYSAAQDVYTGAASDAFGDEALAGGDADNLAMLEKSVPGVPGEDYPIYSEVPETAFVCDGQVDGGYYADPEAECQVFHICTADGQGSLAKYSFLCPNGTVFNQNYFICDWWFNFDCSEAEGLYSLNEEIAAEREAASESAAESAPAAYGVPEQAPLPTETDYDYAAPIESSYEAAAPAEYGAPATDAPLDSYEADRESRAFRGNSRRPSSRRRPNNRRRPSSRNQGRQGRRFRG